ncbi:MAG: 2-C-methyl-D-erythritol 2,4-cyclodiphosphate synthase [Gemmatimonadaceae bacterium]|nr:2-C-methyl-D-erythritol 2,4-cyclodiphosphate synthase [Gemmatimonadaceae bacterium]
MAKASDLPEESPERRSRPRKRAAKVAIRMGIGYDSHRFGPGNAVRLGGISIPYDLALVGHSDADAVAHAVTDALLGAIGEGDIGSMFPDNDPTNRSRDSIEMLTIAMALLRDRGWRANNVDITVIAEAPRIAPFREAMRDALAAALQLDRTAVSVKGKTNEGMGWIGRGEGIACVAVATVVPVAT